MGKTKKKKKKVGTKMKEAYRILEAKHRARMHPPLIEMNPRPQYIPGLTSKEPWLDTHYSNGSTVPNPL
jgi:hypothetical protein